jgi:hypothetical protein
VWLPQRECVPDRSGRFGQGGLINALEMSEQTGAGQVARQWKALWARSKDLQGLSVNSMRDDC